MEKQILVIKPVTCKTTTKPRRDVDLPVGAILTLVKDKSNVFTVVSPDTLAGEVVEIDLSKNRSCLKAKPSVVVWRQDYDRIVGKLKDAIARYTEFPLVRLSNMKVIRDLGPMTNWAEIDSVAWLHKINAEVVTHPSLVVEPFMVGKEKHLGLVYHHLQ